METGKYNIGPVVLAVIITAVVVGGGVSLLQNQQPQIAQKDTQQTPLEQLPLYCSPSGEFVKSKMSDFNGREVIVELYLDCGDGSWFSSQHMYIAASNGHAGPEKILHYSFSKHELEWQFGDNDVQILATKPNIPWEEFKDFGVDNPVEILDLTLNGKELKILDEPTKYNDGGLGGFQGAQFVLTSLSAGTLTFGEKQFTVNLEENTIEELQ